MSRKWWFNFVTFNTGVVILLVLMAIYIPMMLWLVLVALLVAPTLLQRS